MGTVISNLKARFGVDTTDFKKGLKDGDKAVGDFKKAAGTAMDEFASIFGVNMRVVNDSLSTAGKSLNFLGQSFTGAARGGQVLTLALKVLRAAMIATGVGALVVALGSLISYFKGTGEGADKFAVILAKIRSVLDNIIDRIQNFGSGLADIFSGKFREGWDKMRTAFKGIGDEIKEDWKAAGDLTEAMNKVLDREVELITSLEERRARVEDLRLAAKEEMDDYREKLSLLQEAEALIKSVYKDEISLEKERLQIMKEQLERSASDPTREQRRELAEQEAKINALLREQATRLRELTRERNTALKIVNAEVELERKKAETIGITAAAIDNIQIPDFSKVVGAALAPIPEIQKAIKDISIDISETLNMAFESVAFGLGEFLGALAAGNAGVEDFGRVIMTAFADLAINVGRIAIGSGLAVAGIKKALMSLNPWVAIAAGVALVALGSAIKGSLASVASGGGSASQPASPSNFLYDTRVTAAQKVEVVVSGELEGRGDKLVAVINEVNNRRNAGT